MVIASEISDHLLLYSDKSVPVVTLSSIIFNLLDCYCPLMGLIPSLLREAVIREHFSKPKYGSEWK